MKRSRMSLLKLVILLALLLGPGFQPVTGAPEAPAAGGQIVLIAGTVADLEWDPTYPDSFLRWELYRGTSPETMTRVLQGTDQTKGHHRDTGLSPNVDYSYQLDAIYCVEDCSGPEDERTRTIFTDEVTAGLFQGYVRHNLTLAATSYSIGFAGIGSSSGVIVEAGATLCAGTGTKISSATDSSSIRAEEGRLEIDGATLDNVHLDFGRYGDEESWGQGWVRRSTFVNCGIGLWAQSDVEITENEGLQGVNLWEESQATIRDNEIEGSVEIHDSARATVRENTITNGSILLDGIRARATIRENTLTESYSSYGILIWDGSAHVADNTLTFAGFHGSESAALVSVMGEDTSATIERNSLSHGKIAINWGSTVTVTENVLTGGGAAITIGCVVCGNQVQARGLIARNTVRDGWGFEMWGGSHMIPVQYNCIQGNDPGMTLADSSLDDVVQAAHNWWGSPSGPTHPRNPGGSGDRIEGSMVVFEPIDDQPTYCRDTPPPAPEPEPAVVELQAAPDTLAPDGEAQSEITVEVLDDEGEPAGDVDLRFRIVPDAYDEQLGSLMLESCTTGSDGNCAVTYVAPTAEEVFAHGDGAEEVTIEAEVKAATTRGLGPAASAGLKQQATIKFNYLEVVSTSPSQGARNVDWTHTGPWAVFDRALDPESLHETSFQTSSSVYYVNGLPGTMDNSLSIRAHWKIDLSDLEAHPHADDGLIIAVEVKGGKTGVRGEDGTYLRKDYEWKYFTTPVLSPRIIAAQGGESTYLLAGRPAVFRVEAGLSDSTELDYVEADVDLSFGRHGTSSRSAHRFYPDPLTGPREAQLAGNSANFHTQDHEIPILPNGRGRHLVEATLTPTNQQARTIPREYSRAINVDIRLAKSDYAPLEAHIYPIAPTGVFCMDGYTWLEGQDVPGLGQKPVIQGARAAAEGMLPVRTPLWLGSGTRPIRLYTPPVSSCDKMLPEILKRYRYRGRLTTDAVLLLGPDEWIRNLNGNDLIFHDSFGRHCIAGEGAPAETLAHCLGHAYGPGDDAGGPVRGYDVVRRRYVNTAHPVTGYSAALMDHNLAQAATGGERVWIGVNTYDRLMEAFSGSTTRAQRLQTEGAMAVGGMLSEEGGAVAGVLNLIDWPAAGAGLPDPEGTGAYGLRLRDAGGSVLATHAISPAFGTLSGGTPYASFLYAVDAPEETKTVELLRGGDVLDSINASDSPPTVTVTQPSGGTHSGPMSVAWEGSDTDDGELQYYVYLSSDDGGTWTPLALGTTESSLTFESTEHANGAQCRLRVAAHDGFHSATADSVTFTLANPPQVEWVWPAEGSNSAGRYVEIAVGFRDDMDGGTIDAQSFAVVDGEGQPVSGTVAYATDARRAVFIPSTALTYGRAYTARLDETIADGNGQTLGADVSWSFRVETGPFALSLPVLFRN